MFFFQIITKDVNNQFEKQTQPSDNNGLATVQNVPPRPNRPLLRSTLFCSGDDAYEREVLHYPLELVESYIPHRQYGQYNRRKP